MLEVLSNFPIRDIYEWSKTEFVNLFQMDKNTGLQISASSLTWSYANILHALHVRKNCISLRIEVLGF